MNPKTIDLIAGARPNFMKIAPIIRAINQNKTYQHRIKYRLIHTGQHYDQNMSGNFFDQLGIPAPDFNLNVGSGTQASQTAGIMMGYEDILMKQKSDLCVVVGDVTSTMACAITAQKMLVPVAHVEGGIRSNDWTMPEEINRMATDAVTNWFFTTSEYADENLRRMGVVRERIFFVGNTMIDTLLQNLDRLQKPDFWDSLGLNPKDYFVLTLHRPANVDQELKLKKLMQTIIDGAKDKKIIFPVHPRTAKILNKLGISSKNLHMVEPMGYLEFNYLVQSCFAVITDSGGITEEATVLDVPCMTLRDSTERPETVTMGTNELVGTDPNNLRPYLEKLFSGKWKTGQIPPLWDGKAAERIVKHICTLL
ncbi:non-hydrolyzing UDP-N-acetylglucosamine 2-epimerase [Desulfonatronovibrio hydrogenovorans]|uniref:non-hydrolyzing UDP-N-acetylglucosamine 2-epimerase n=1 Tax=Desulfonatronovibrio hydrogenovorans TaxID=53245 RepID=UPI00048BA4C2|nr:UDP-N-acetylglucosamine 2-epimerase (non-hydrolyzing) [Desulfonatronovibrio hydrogenovorans]